MSADNKTASSSSAPVKLLHEGVGHVVTVELKSGETYRGLLSEAEDTMNCHMKEVIFSARDGRVSKLEQVFVRGGQIRYIQLPSILKEAPILKRIKTIKTKSDEKEKPASSKPRDPSSKRPRK